ncbi:MAG TPA: ROK family protein [Candidatus Saccharimonadales bacterium]|nr:ROK family protein [Candidatus Saccharimonadales bacterium]
MYVGVDVGGTKTLVAVLTDDGEIREQTKFPTPQNYQHFLLELRHTLAHFKHRDFRAGAIGIAGLIDREHGRRMPAGQLRWNNVPIQADVEHILDCPTLLENDAKLACLSEALLLKGEYQRVLYLTVSTGLGYALTVNGQIDPNIGDRGGTTIMVEQHNQHVAWEDLASGRAIVERYGKKAMDITDHFTWQAIVRDLAKGLSELIAITEPEIIIIGGSVGVYFNRYGRLLHEELKQYTLPSTRTPELRQAKRPEEAVVYGCYDLAKQRFGHAATTH